jgi:hypothetical protein
VQYFKHSSSMRNDVKLKRVIAKYGLEGYGLYNLVVEAITERVDTDNPMPFLEETCDDIAEFYNCNSAHVDEMMRYMISQGLFSVETVEKKVACFKLYSFLEKSQTRSDKIKQLIDAYKDKSNLLGLPNCPGLSETNLIEENRREKTKNKNKNKNRTEYGDDFLIFWNAYPRKANKGVASGAYNSAIDSGKTHDEIMYRLAVYKSQIAARHTEEKYIKNPSTFLNNIDDFNGAKIENGDTDKGFYLPPERRIPESLIKG